MLPYLFGSKVWPSVNVTCINGVTPHINSGGKHGGMVEDNTFVGCIRGRGSD